MNEKILKLDSFQTHLRMVEPAALVEQPSGVVASQVLWVSDRAVWSVLTGPDAPSPSIRSALLSRESQVLLLDPGEDHKDWEQVTRILDRGFSMGLARDSWIVGIGGGVVTDLVAFAASLFMRGCHLLLIPTTLLSQVDATLGGKTGINFGGHKNMVGSFYPAHEIRIVPDLLMSLPLREYRGGLAEVIKHGFLVGGELLDRIVGQRLAILARDPSILAGLVWDSLMVKARVVEADLKEEGVRAHLNLGHTFAHGLEAAAGFGVWNHGDAVAWGMIKAARLAEAMGLCSPDWANSVHQLLLDYGFADQAPGVSTDRIIEAMLSDKKKKGGQVRFVLQRAVADTFLQAVPEGLLRTVIALY